MALKICMVVVFVVLAATLLQSTYAATYAVGDSSGWQIPTGNPNLYDDWAGNKSFVVGDVLVFDFTTGQHTVEQVMEPAYDACTTSNAISTETTGPARITLRSTGDHYFICGIAGHCSAGQKLKVEVRNGISTAPTPGSSPTTPGILNPPSAASSLVATISLVFMSIALVLLC